MSSRLPRDMELELIDRIDEMKKERKKRPIRSAPAAVQAQQVPVLLYAKVVGRPGTETKSVF